MRRPASKDFVASGTVYQSGVERQGEPLPGASVRAWPEGAPASAAEAQSDDGGYWSLSLPQGASGRVVLSVAAPGFATTWRALTAAPYTQVSIPVALEALEELDCGSGQCTVASDGLRVDNPPEGAFGFARALDPASLLGPVAGVELLRPLAAAYLELDAGEFDPDAGGFAGDGGQGVARLALRLPVEAWKRLDDLAPGTGRIEVPVRAFDPTTGAWTARADGVLLGEGGLELPETALGPLRSGTFALGAVASFPVPQSGLWAVAFAAASAGCVEGKVEVEGGAEPGVLAQVAPHEASASVQGGAFCAPARLGAVGETAPLGLHYAGISYAGQSVPLPQEAGACGSSACKRVGTVKLTAQATVSATPCKVTGTVKEPSGAPLPGAVVVALDDTVPRSVFTTLCGKLGTRCTLAAPADGQGHFELVVPVQTGVLLQARAFKENLGSVDSLREGSLRVPGCPEGPVDFPLRVGRDQLEVQAQLSGAQLSWTPARPAYQVRASDADGGLKWDVVAPLGLAPPLTYGQVPSGAAQKTPAAGGPPPLAPEDVLEVLMIGTDPSGYQWSGGAAVAVP